MATRNLWTGNAERWLQRALMAVMVGALGTSLVAGRANAQAKAEEKVLNLYSARHYQTDEALYEDFTKQTGIKINRIELGDEPLVQRLKSEGANSPADVVLLVDAARLWRAQQDGLFQPVKSNVLDTRIPANLRADDGSWYGFSTRARVIVYNKLSVKPNEVATYESLADPVNKGKVCTRSGSHPYMLSLIGAMVERNGEAKTEEWARGVVNNMARAPKGGDTDQIRAVATGECGIALTNTYYFARMMRSKDAKDREVVERVGFLWPNQATTGTHVNVSGAAVAKNAPHPQNAKLFLEYLSGDSAQKYFAAGNNEWPAVKSVKVDNAALAELGDFKSENVPVSAMGKGQVAAQRILDKVGYR